MSLDNFTIKNYGDGEPVNVRSTVVNPVSPDVDVHIPHHVSEVAPVEDRVSGAGHATNGTSTAITGIGAVASKQNYVSAVQVANMGASAVLVLVQDGSGGTTLAYIACPAGETAPVTYPSPLATSVNTGLFFQVIDSVPSPATNDVYVSAQGYTE